MGAAAGEEQAASPGKDESQKVPAAPVIDTKLDVEGAMSKVGLKKKENETKDGKWNTSNLGSRLGVDLMCAAAAGGLVAPIVTVIDKQVKKSIRMICRRTNSSSDQSSRTPPANAQ